MASREAMFRKYHRQLAKITFFPLLLMALTGLTSPVLEALHFNNAAEVVRQIHSGRLFLGSAYWLYTGLTALALLWLLLNGLKLIKSFGDRTKTRKQAREQLNVSNMRK